MPFTPPSPDTLVEDSKFTPPDPSSLVKFTPPSPDSIVQAQPVTQKSPSQILAETRFKGATAAGKDLAIAGSLLGISPEDIPSGANTTAPAITIPLSAAGKAAAGALQFATTPKNMLEIAGTSTVAAPAIYAKWAYDMIKGGLESATSAGEKVATLIRDHINRQMASQTGGEKPPVDKELIQGLADDAVNSAVGLLGGTSVGLHGVKSLVKLPKSLQETPTPTETPPAPEKPPVAPVVKPTTPFEAAPEPQPAPESEVKTQGAEVAGPKTEAAPVPPSAAATVQTVPPEAPSAGTAETPVSAGAEPATPSVTPPVTEPQVAPATMTGAAHISEIPDIGESGDIYGIAQRIREQRAKAGVTVPIEPGQGVSAADAVAHGIGVLEKDPTAAQKAVDAFNKDKSISFDGVSVARAQGEKAWFDARRIEERMGTDSPQYQAAKAAAIEWEKRSKPMQTEWSKIGQAQQGQTDIDTSSFTGLSRARVETTGKEFTEAQKPKATRIAADNKNAQDAVNQAAEKLNNRIRQKVVTDPESAKVWELAEKYLDENKGLYGFDDLRNKIATDLGMKPDQVTRIMARDSATKKLADDLWIKQRNARRLKEQAKMWLKSLDTPGYLKALGSIPRFLFSLSVFGHGFVALGTHAPIVAFQPRFWNAYVRNFGKMYKMVFSPAYYESQMADLVRRPNYERARRAGLQNDPFQYEEFQTSMMRDMVKDWVGEKNMDRVDKFASAGNRGYGVLKLLRQDMFDQKYSKLPDSVRKQPGVTEAMADDINHATGVTKAGAPKGSNLLLFAPRLAGSRVMWLGGDPIRAAKTVANWKNATVAEKQFAIDQMKEKAWVFGTFASLLAANQGILIAAGSNQKINGIPKGLGGAGFDPLAGDFMKFKAAGGDIAYGGALLTMAKLPVRVATAILYEGKGSKYILEDERVDKVIGSYIRSQMSPFAGTITDLALGRDYEERPLPAKMFGMAEQTGNVPKRLQAQGIDEPYNWAEFTATKLPIPIAEGIKEGLRGSGMSDEQANYWMRAMAITTLMTATGTRITEDTREE